MRDNSAWTPANRIAQSERIRATMTPMRIQAMSRAAIARWDEAKRIEHGVIMREFWEKRKAVKLAKGRKK